MTFKSLIPFVPYGLWFAALQFATWYLDKKAPLHADEPTMTRIDGWKLIAIGIGIGALMGFVAGLAFGA